MRWLIVEDALRDRNGHWFEYLGTFARELRVLGDEVTVLGDQAAEPFLREQLSVQPVLPASIWHRMGDGAGPLARYLRVPVHAWQTYRALKKYFRSHEVFDLVFVPTVMVHHLLGWTWLIKKVLRTKPTRILLFFPNTPVLLRPGTGKAAWLPTPTAKLFCRLIQSLKEEVASGRVVLGAETEPMRAVLAELTGVPFSYFPHPVAAAENSETLKTEKLKSGLETAVAGGQPPTYLTFGSYGSAREEKGSDVLITAVVKYCRLYPDSRVQFVLQCVGGDQAQWKSLQDNPRVQLINHYFADGDYVRQLCATDALLLPYRRSSYDLRVSRVVIEAMMQGLPVVATQGTTLASQADEFGAAVLCQDGDVASLVTAIRDLEERFEALKQCAEKQQPKCVGHFSVRQFRGNLLG